MRESDTYQAILDEGRDEGRITEARLMLLRIGRHRLGEIDAPTLSRLELISDLSRLEQLADRLLEVESWNELLD